MSKRGAKDGFNRPFKALKLKVTPPSPQKPAPAPPKAKPARSTDDDSELFAAAMDGVVPITNRGSAPELAVPTPRIVNDEAEALARLSELVSGDGPFDIANTDEFIEGGAPGLDRRVLQALRRGDYAVQGHLDLHGLSRNDARDEVSRFVTESRRAGKRCVLIVHGRGLHSKDQIPVLKDQLTVWLNRGSLARAVLAFATARPHDGGAGAVYVLLRR